MAVIFKKLVRGLWKNKGDTPTITRQYSHLTSEEGCKNFQVKLRQSSVDTSKYYSYTPSLSVSNKILFGVDGVSAYDFNNYARMPFKQPNSVVYHGRSKNINCQLTQPLDNSDKMFSADASKYSSGSGIFYSNQQPPISISNCTWEGLSVADKNSIPALLQVDKSTKEKAAGTLMVKSFKFLSAVSGRSISINQQGITDGSTVYRFDPDNDATRIKYIYVISQAPGGNGGISYGGAVTISSGSGGGAGGYSIDLIRIPDNGTISIYIPKVPPINRGYEGHDDHKPTEYFIKITHSDGTVLREIECGGWGRKSYLTRAGWWDFIGSMHYKVAGGFGGKVIQNSSHPLNITGKIQNIKNVTGADGAINAFITNIGSGEEPIYVNVVSGASQEIIINNNTVDTISSDGKITIPSVPGITSHWDSVFNEHIPGGGGSSPLGRGGDFQPLHNGYSGDGPGAGGGGGAKHVLTEHFGGAGREAAIYIGF